MGVTYDNPKKSFDAYLAKHGCSVMKDGRFVRAADVDRMFIDFMNQEYPNFEDNDWWKK